MPPHYKTLGLILLLLGPSGLLAQDYHAPRTYSAQTYSDRTQPPSTPPQPAAPIELLSHEEPVQPAPLRLAPPSARSPSSSAPKKQAEQQSVTPQGFPSAVTVIGSLAVVLGVFFLVAWGLRRASPRAAGILPGEVFETLGRAPMDGRQQVHLLRCGNKLLLVSVTPAGAETLTEITDPMEVDRLAGLCQQANPNSSTAAFRQVFGQFAPRRGEPKPDSLGPDSLGDAQYGQSVAGREYSRTLSATTEDRHA